MLAFNSHQLILSNTGFSASTAHSVQTQHKSFRAAVRGDGLLQLLLKLLKANYAPLLPFPATPTATPLGNKEWNHTKRQIWIKKIAAFVLFRRPFQKADLASKFDRLILLYMQFMMALGWLWWSTAKAVGVRKLLWCCFEDEKKMDSEHGCFRDIFSWPFQGNKLRSAQATTSVFSLTCLYIRHHFI